MYLNLTPLSKMVSRSFNRSWQESSTNSTPKRPQTTLPAQDLPTWRPQRAVPLEEITGKIKALRRHTVMVTKAAGEVLVVQHPTVPPHTATLEAGKYQKREIREHCTAGWTGWRLGITPLARGLIYWRRSEFHDANAKLPP